MKKLLSLLLALSMAVSLAACGNTPAAGSQNPAQSGQTSQTDQSGEPANTGDQFPPSNLFCGSTSLYPIISSLASSFTEDNVTWDKLDLSFPDANISIYVAPGGSGVGVSAAIDKTADFGMLARDIKDSEV